MNQIIFVGGIHGVGKSTICKMIASTRGYTYLSASEILKWKELNTDKTGKKVTDIADSQIRLISALKNVLEPGKRYVLDGHFCLFNQDNIVTPIPIDTFEKIAPSLLILITRDAQEIATVLAKRDNRSYSATLLEQMQTLEVSYAKEVAEHLRITLRIFSNQPQHMANQLAQLYESLT